jgi:uncharacterized protein YukE
VKKLTKDQIAQHTKLSAELNDVREKLEAAVKRFNEKVAVEFSELETIVEALNEKTSEANAFIEEIHDEQESFYDERSEKWQEGDAGSAYSDWMSTWEISIEPIELMDLPAQDVPQIEGLEDFESLETECSS